MKTKSFLLAVAAIVIALVSSCGGDPEEDPVKGSISVYPEAVEAKASGESFEITVKANKYWNATSSQSWVKVSPASGAANEAGATVTVTVDKNTGDARQAEVNFEFYLDDASAKLSVSQQKYDPEAIQELTVSEFRSMQDSESKWYTLTAEIISISKPQYGDMYVGDETGQVYVYGMAPTQNGSTTDFPKLNLGVGDVVTFVAHKSTYNEKIEAKGAYYVSHKDGQPRGTSSLAASQKWLELPETKNVDDGILFLTHPKYKGGRNYSVYYDTANRIAKWVCYPYVKGDGGTGRNGDPYAYDPLLSVENQPDLTKSYQNRTFGSEEFIRGHMLPSNDRSGRDNYEVFFSTNIMPQSSNLNSGVWGLLELEAHNVWSKNCDTLYVVTGTYAGSSDRFVTDNSDESRKSLVPEGIYKAFLARLSDGTYRALGTYFENKTSSASDFTKDLSISIDKLEEKVKVDLFVNLPDDVESKVEAEDPSSVDWWWN